MASSRSTFDDHLMFSSQLLTHEEGDSIRPRYHRNMADELVNDADVERSGILKDVCFSKTHDAWTYVNGQGSLLGGDRAAHGAILVVRDPRDVAISFANHLNQAIDPTIEFMNNREATLCGRRDRFYPQLRQRLSTWSEFNRSWLDQREIPVHVVRYEDLHTNPKHAFRTALAFAGVDISRAEAERVISLASFENLRHQETQSGFGEVIGRGIKVKFFRRGAAGSWREDLSETQAIMVTNQHADVMRRLGYDL